VAWTVLEALRPLGEKTPHRYVSLQAAASELATLGQKTVQYIYDALQQLKDRLIEAWRLWPLVKAIRAYSAHTVRRRDDPCPVGGQTVEGKVEIHDYAVQIKDARPPPLC
jgi:hypothetical protein